MKTREELFTERQMQRKKIKKKLDYKKISLIFGLVKRYT